MKHRVTGEEIDVDFLGPTADVIDHWFFLNHLRSLRLPEPPEKRLLALHQSVRSIKLAVDELIADGLLVPVNSREIYQFRLAPELLEHTDAIDAFCRMWACEPSRVCLAALIGDWPAAHETARELLEHRCATVLVKRESLVRRKRCDELLIRLEGDAAENEALLALADLDAEVLPAQLGRALDGPVSPLTSAAVEIIRCRDDRSWCFAVDRLVARLNPSGELHQTFLWSQCVEFLLRHQYRADEAGPLLSRASGPEIGTAALLAFEYAPSAARTLFRRALRSEVPINRIDAAAILATIDRPWSRSEMVAVLRESTDQELTAECRAALRESHDADAHRVVDTWEAENPHEPERGSVITMREMALKNTASWIRDRMTKYHDRVMRWRHRVPDAQES